MRVDGALSPSSVLIGGVGQGDFAPVKITSPLVGPNDFGGCVLSVNDSDFEQFSRCGTGYDESIGLMEKVSNHPPRLSLGQDVTGSATPPSGKNYKVFFESGGIKIRPVLDERDEARLAAHARIYANYRNGMLSTQEAGSHDAPALWYGYVWTWDVKRNRRGPIPRSR